MNDCKVIAIDIAKEVFQVCIMTSARKILLNKKLRRTEFTEFMQNQAPTAVAMEACYSCHYWGGVFESLGHKVTLLPAQHVKPFVRGNKSDKNDAIAIGEAFYRPNIHPVPLKIDEQLDIQTLHQIRNRLIADRTRLMNQARGLLSDRGIITGLGHAHFKRLMSDITSAEFTGLSEILKEEFGHMFEEYITYSNRIKDIDKKLQRLSQENPLCRLLLTIVGIGVINATAIYAAIGDGKQFKTSRDFAVWLGLTPRQASSGTKSSSGGITKRGNSYVRKQLVHGARAALTRCKNKKDRLNLWACEVMERRGHNKACVALAAKMSRIAWVLLQKKEAYKVFDVENMEAA